MPWKPVPGLNGSGPVMTQSGIMIMSQVTEQRERARLKRVGAVIRAWDGPNSRIALELDLDQMPWGPFESLGKQMTLLVPTEGQAAEVRPTPELEDALRHVEHAADRCAEFSRLGNGSEQVWKSSLETWRWLRGHLTGLLASDELRPTGSGPTPPIVEPTTSQRPAPEAPLPHMPGAASTLEAVAGTLRSLPLSLWRTGGHASDPEAPTREESIQTLLGIARILSSSAPEAPTSPVVDDARDQTPESEGDEDLSFEYASGYDEGYQMGRRVGRALAAREARDGSAARR